MRYSFKAQSIPRPGYYGRSGSYSIGGSSRPPGTYEAAWLVNVDMPEAAEPCVLTSALVWTFMVELRREFWHGFGLAEFVECVGDWLGIARREPWGRPRSEKAAAMVAAWLGGEG